MLRTKRADWSASKLRASNTPLTTMKRLSRDVQSFSNHYLYVFVFNVFGAQTINSRMVQAKIKHFYFSNVRRYSSHHEQTQETTRETDKIARLPANRSGGIAPTFSHSTLHNVVQYQDITLQISKTQVATSRHPNVPFATLSAYH